MLVEQTTEGKGTDMNRYDGFPSGNRSRGEIVDIGCSDAQCSRLIIMQSRRMDPKSRLNKTNTNTNNNNTTTTKSPRSDLPMKSIHDPNDSVHRTTENLEEDIAQIKLKIAQCRSESEQELHRCNEIQRSSDILRENLTFEYEKQCRSSQILDDLTDKRNTLKAQLMHLDREIKEMETEVTRDKLRREEIMMEFNKTAGSCGSERSEPSTPFKPHVRSKRRSSAPDNIRTSQQLQLQQQQQQQQQQKQLSVPDNRDSVSVRTSKSLDPNRARRNTFMKNSIADVINNTLNNLKGEAAIQET